jgi:hypothetical protein
MLKEEAIKHFGNMARLAKAIGVTRQAVYQWQGPEVPELYQYKLHHLTRGALPLSPHLQRSRAHL